MRRRLWVLFVAGLALLVLTSAACSSSGDDGSGGGGATSAAGGGETQTSEAPTGGGGGGEPDLKAEDFQFDPTELSVASGDTIVVKNDAPSTPHTFTVTDTDIDESLDPDAEVDVKIDLDPGTYDFMCTIHPQMTGTLTVT
jgi:plastocyanin